MKDDIDIEEQDMKDEIDIEEHDVLDNPRIRTIFPDLAQIKKEISGDYHGPDSRIEYQPYYRKEDSRQYVQEDTSEYARFGNKISKPSSTLRISEDIQNGESVLVCGRKSVEIKQEAEEYEETTEEVNHPEDVHEEKYNSVSTVLILSSTSSSSGVIEPLTINNVSHNDNELAKSKFFNTEIDLNCEDNDSDHDIDTKDPKDPTAALVLLENWGPRLENNSCYCKECLILFSTSNTLLAHNMTAHSLLVAVDKNKAVKSTAKPNVKKVSNDSGKFCNHCNVSNGLINYLYEKLTFAKNNALFKPQPKKVVPNPSNKTVLPKQLEDDAELGSEMQVHDQEAVNFYQCQVCSIYLELYGFFVKHMINNHSKTEFTEEKVLFIGTCLLCNTNVKDKQNYNKHIKLLHPEVYYYKGPITIPKGHVKKKQVGIKNNELAKSKTKFFDRKIDFNCEDNDDYDIDTNDPKDSTAALVLLENWGPRLENSSRYCKECLILFPTNNTLLAHNTTVHSVLVAVDKNKAVKSKVYHFYICIKCKCCIAMAMGRNHHRCPSANKIEQCKICHLYFNVSILTRHTKFHELNPKLSKKNIKCTPFRPKTSDKGFKIKYEANNEEMLTLKLYKCQCGLHFTSTNAAEKHFKSCGAHSDTAKEKCSKCKRLFDTTQIVTHLCKHHSTDEKNTKFEIVNVMPGDESKTQYYTVNKSAPGFSDKRKTLYKCRRCDVCYLSAGGLAYHFETNHQVSKVRPCPYCQLKFMPMTLRKHITLQHHQLIQCKAKDFIIRTGVYKDGLLKILDIESKPVNKALKKIINKVKKANPKSDLSLIKTAHREVNLAAYNNTLYKCKVCRGHFLTKRALKSHLLNNKSIKRHRSTLVNCPDCNFTFKPISLLKHRYVHHETMKLQREDFKFKCLDVLHEIDTESDVEKSYNKSEVENTSQDSADNSQCSVEISGKFSEGDNASSAVDTISYNTNNIDDLATSHVKNKQSKIFSYTNILYKCGICNATCQSSCSIEYHLKEHPSDNKYLVPCFCGLNFSRAALLKHTVLHHDKQNLSKDDLYILTMGLYDKYAAGKYLFRCETCHVYFSTLKILENHLSTEGHSVHKTICPHCGLMISTRSLPWHVKVHHAIMKLKREDFVVFESFGKNKLRLLEPLAKKETNPSEKLIRSKATLHKCGSCGTHYINASDLDLHQATCQQDTNDTVVCEQCQLKFSKNGLETHFETHHKNLQLKIDDFKIIYYGDDDNIVRDDNIKELTVKDTEVNGKGAFTSAMSTENEDSLIDKDDDTSGSENKNPSKSELYQCGKCKCCFNSKSNIKRHYLICESNQPNKKCDQCQLMFPTKVSLTAHINRHHRNDNFKFRVIIVNYYGEKSAMSRVLKTVSSKQPLDIDDDTSGSKNKIASKKELYQCGKCKTCFNRHDRIKQHYEACEISRPTKKCDQCQLRFPSKISLNAHISVHHRSDNFKFHVITVNYDEKSVISRVLKTVSSNKSLEITENVLNKLYQCGKCKSCFNYIRNFKHHYQICEIIQPNIKCDQCQLMFLSKISLNAHISVHHRSDNFKFQVILVNNDEKSAISRVVKTVSSKKPLDKDGDTSESKNKTAKKIVKLFQCGKCKTCFFTDNYIKQHYKKCQSTQPNIKCDQCQLMFPQNKSFNVHINRHHRSDNFKFHVILVNYNKKSATSRVVKTVSSNKPLDKYDDTSESKNKNAAKLNKLSKLYQCGKCKTCFNNNINIKQHYNKCGSIQPNKICDHCQLMFSSKISLKMHLNRHHRSDNFKFHVILVNHDEKSAISQVVKTVSSNKQIEITENVSTLEFDLHQAIYQQDTNNTAVREQCPLKFSKNGLETHVEKHHRNMQLKIDDFQTIDYGDDINKDDGIEKLTAKDTEENSNEVFTSTMSTENEDSIIDKDDDTSEIKNENVNINKLYQCGKCKACFNSNKSIKQHYEECESIQPNKKCDQCQLMFHSIIALTMHINRHHRSDNFKFHVIVVNYNEKSAISRVVKTVSSKKPLDKDDNTLESKNANKSKKLSRLYQCGKCKSCFNSIKGIKLHYSECESVQPNKKCDQCQLMFHSKRSLTMHINRHHKSGNIKFYVILVNYDEKSGISQVLQTVSSNKPLEITENVSNKLYQCGKCKSCFIYKKPIKLHYQFCESIQPNNKCDQCQLMFLSNKSLNMHINRHHRSDNFKFHVILVNIDENSAISRVLKTVSSKKLLDKDDYLLESKNANKSKKLSKLYQCGKCKSCFNSNKGIKLHYAKCESFQPNNKCDQCQLMFLSNKSLNMHINRYHRSDNFEFHVILVNIDKKSALSRRVLKTVSSKKHLDKGDDDTSESKNKNANKLSKLYQCGKCKTCLPYGNIKRHYEDCDSIHSNNKCELCQLMFLSIKSLNKHINRHHRSDNFKFHVILVNYHEKSAISRVVKTVSSKRPLDKDDDTSESKNTNANKNKLYQCGKCKGCFNTNRTRQHYAECGSIQPNNKCDQCQLMFLSNRSLNMHINRHHRSDNFKFHVILVNIDEKSAISRRVLKIVSSEKPLDKDDDTSESKNKKANKLSKLYQCGKCKSCFFTYGYIKRHYEDCDSIQPNNKCDQCQLMFFTNLCLNMHINRHHRNNYFKFHVILVNYDEKSALLQVVKTLSSKKPLEITENVSTLDKKLYTNQLFKCNTCFIHFLLEESLEIHTKHSDVNIPKSTCTCCGLIFSVNTLPTHIYIHHEKMKLNAEHFDITSKDEYMDD